MFSHSSGTDTGPGARSTEPLAALSRSRIGRRVSIGCAFALVLAMGPTGGSDRASAVGKGAHQLIGGADQPEESPSISRPMAPTKDGDDLDVGVETSKVYPRIERWAGGNAAEIAAEASAATVPTPARGRRTESVYVVGDDAFPDALQAGVIASRESTSVLAVSRDVVPEVTRAEIRRLNPRRIIVVGGTSRVSVATAESLAEPQGAELNTAATTTRTGGSDRYATAQRLDSNPQSIVYATDGESGGLALAAAVAAARAEASFVLTGSDRLRPDTRKRLKAGNPMKIVLAASSRERARALEREIARTLPAAHIVDATGASVQRSILALADAPDEKPTDGAVVVRRGSAEQSAAVVPAAARSAAPLLFGEETCSPRATLAAMKQGGSNSRIIIGDQSAISDGAATIRCSSEQMARTVRSGSGNLRVVPGASKKSGSGRLTTYRVLTEKGLPDDQDFFARRIDKTLADERSWIGVEKVSVKRVSSRTADVQIVLASPRTVDSLCAPLNTNSYTSCRTDVRGISSVVLNQNRWNLAVPGFAGDLATYRNYLINHEFGHALGHGHEHCAGRGKTAPVMQQQTLRLEGCKPNGWPARD